MFKSIIISLELCVDPCVETSYEIKKESVHLDLDDINK